MAPLRSSSGLLVVVGAFLCALASGQCGSTDVPDDGNGNGDGGVNPNQYDGDVFDPNKLEGGVDQNPTNPTCHDQSFLPQKVGDPDIMVLMDMSSSMDEGSPTKYSQTAGAVTNVVTSLEQAGSPIQWGLIFFPSDGDCAVAGAPNVPIADGNASQIASAINGTSPNGNTPTHKAENLAVQYYSGLGDGRAHYILLATDGQPNCESDTGFPTMCTDNSQCKPGEYCQVIPGFGGMCVPLSQDLAINAIGDALSKGIKTYVVGIDIDGAGIDTLNRMAEAGGTARPADPKYYPVTDQASLEQTLSNITEQIISCTFALDALPESPDYVSVTVGSHGVPHDPNHQNGWDIDEATRTMTFYGDACAELQQNPQAVSVTYGCPPVS